ncbi:MAG: hypothetical protein GC202_13790 [Alphaproteobacteria bacterium]|nr:hypothetical protein [Alphaproteobacteria bacterium]
MLRRLLFLTALLAASPAHAVDEKAMNEAVRRNHIVPAYAQLSAATGAFADLAAKGCADREALRGGFEATVNAWEGVQHIRFGPAEWFDRGARFEFWPDPRDIVGRQLAGIFTKRQIPAFEDSSVAIQGLTALERVLWDDDGRKLADSFVCRWVSAATAGLAAMARDMEAEWRADKFFATRPAVDSARDVFKALHLAVELVADHKLARPLGANAAAARPHLAEFWRSRLSGQAVAANLDAAADLFAAMVPFVPDQALADEVTRRLSALRAKARGLDLDAGFADPAARPEIDGLRKDLRALKELLATRMTAVLDLPLGFNGLDGD